MTESDLQARFEALQQERDDLRQMVGHRACLGVEHDPLRGKIHGYCVICGVPFPCPQADRVEQLQADLATAKEEIIPDIEEELRQAEARADALAVQLEALQTYVQHKPRCGATLCRLCGWLEAAHPIWSESGAGTRCQQFLPSSCTCGLAVLQQAHPQEPEKKE